MRVDDWGISVVPEISQYSFANLPEAPSLHRWRAYWSEYGIELRAYPVTRLTPCGVWIDTDAYRNRTDDGWEFDDWHTLRWVANDSNRAWAKPTREDAIKSLAVRLTRWSQKLVNESERILRAVNALRTIRPELATYADTAERTISAIQKGPSHDK